MTAVSLTLQGKYGRFEIAGNITVEEIMMPFYGYKAKKPSGEIVSDIIEAHNERYVINQLHEWGYFPIKVTVAKPKQEKLTGVGSQMFTRVTSRDLTIFTRQLANLVKAGLPLVRGLDVLTRQTENHRLREIIKSLKNDVQRGDTFSAALAKHERLFSPLYVGMVKAGEAGGVLEIVMERLASFREKEDELVGRVKAALAYPIIMVIIGIAVIVLLMTFVIPRFGDLFASLDQNLPVPTQMVILASNFISKWWWLILIILVTVGVLFRQFARTNEGKLAVDRVKLRLPVLGKVTNKVVISRFALTLSTLLRNGVPILTAMAMVSDAIGNKAIAEEISAARGEIGGGKSLAAPLTRSKFFPPMVTDMIAVGEETGKLEQSLEEIAAAYDREVELAIKAFTSMLEPILILIMGIFVGFIVLAMLLPVFNITTSLQ